MPLTLDSVSTDINYQTGQKLSKFICRGWTVELGTLCVIGHSASDIAVDSKNDHFSLISSWYMKSLWIKSPLFCTKLPILDTKIEYLPGIEGNVTHCVAVDGSLWNYGYSPDQTASQSARTQLSSPSILSHSSSFLFIRLTFFSIIIWSVNLSILDLRSVGR